MSYYKDLHHHRRNYMRHELTEKNIAPDPFEQFSGFRMQQMMALSSLTPWHCQPQV